MDRIDIHIEVPAVGALDLTLPPPCRGDGRGGSPGYCPPGNVSRNAITPLAWATGCAPMRRLTGKCWNKWRSLIRAGGRCWPGLVEMMKLTARGYHRVLRVARARWRTLTALTGSVKLISPKRSVTGRRRPIRTRTTKVRNPVCENSRFQSQKLVGRHRNLSPSAPDRHIQYGGFPAVSPITLVLSTLGYWLTQEGVDAETIGLLAVVTMPYSLKFLWSPLIDWIKLPLLHTSIGRRRSWLFLIQAGLTAAILFLGSTNPVEGAILTGLGALLVSFMSASQDIVLDAYRIEILEDEELPAGAAMIQFGYRTGNYISGTGGLALAALYDWHVAYYVLSLQVLSGLIPALLLGEPKGDGHELVEEETEVIEHWLEEDSKAPTALSLFVENFYLSVVVPFKEFTKRHGWMLILLFIVLLKIGDGMASVMTPVLVVDLGFSNAEIIYANKTVGAIALLIGIFVGGLLLKWTGTYRGLFIAAVLMMVSNLSFAVLNEVGYNVPLLAFTIGFESFASGIGGTLAIAYLSGLCNLAYTATQYALLSSLASVGRGFLAAPSGFGYAEWGATNFFVFTTIAALPAIGLLVLDAQAGLRFRRPPGSKADLTFFSPPGTGDRGGSGPSSAA